jgi:hypothetical protein
MARRKHGAREIIKLGRDIAMTFEVIYGMSLCAFSRALSGGATDVDRSLKHFQPKRIYFVDRGSLRN